MKYQKEIQILGKRLSHKSPIDFLLSREETLKEDFSLWEQLIFLLDLYIT